MSEGGQVSVSVALIKGGPPAWPPGCPSRMVRGSTHDPLSITSAATSSVNNRDNISAVVALANWQSQRIAVIAVQAPPNPLARSQSQLGFAWSALAAQAQAAQQRRRG